MANVLMLLDKEFPNDDRVEKEAVSLIQNGFQVSILCPTFQKRSKKENYNGISVYRFSINKMLFNKILGLIQILPLYKYLWFNKIKKLFGENYYDIIHIHDLPLCCVIDKVKNAMRVKIVADMHENYPAMVAGQEHVKRFPNKHLISVKQWYKLEKEWLKNTDLIICTASGMIRRLKTVLEPGHTFALVPNTIEVDAFQSSQKPDRMIEQKFINDFVLLSYGVVSEQRGIQYVIQAVSLLKEKIPNIKLVVLGDGAFLNNLKSIAEELNSNDHIAFEGWKSQSVLMSYMKNTSVCVIPHFKSEHTDNTSPNKLFHFMYFGKPIIASDCNYIQELIEQENCGITYKYDDPKALAECILYLYENRIEGTEMGMNGIKAVMSTYNWHKTVIPMINEYKKLLDS